MNNAKAGNYGSALEKASNTNIDMSAVMDGLSKYDKVGNRGSVISPFGKKGGSTSKDITGTSYDVKKVKKDPARHKYK